MRNALRPLVIAGTVAAILVGAAAQAGAKEVSTTKYAKTVCGTYTGYADARQKFIDAYNALPSSDPAGFKAQAVTLATTLQEHTKQLTAPYKYPREIHFVEELPKTVSGKIRRSELRQWLREGIPGE